MMNDGILIKVRSQYKKHLHWLWSRKYSPKVSLSTLKNKRTKFYFKVKIFNLPVNSKLYRMCYIETTLFFSWFCLNSRNMNLPMWVAVKVLSEDYYVLGRKASLLHYESALFTYYFTHSTYFIGSGQQQVGLVLCVTFYSINGRLTFLFFSELQ